MIIDNYMNVNDCLFLYKKLIVLFCDFLYKVLWSFMSAKKDHTGEPEKWKFSKVRVLVVDEGSLVSVQILHSLLSMLTKHAQLQKFILLGKNVFY